ncbi:MAG: hypothetical protein JXR64_02810 [Spirochaetales bacterium]|nr:hypothetical protein [Spirochaetales bacterium]
MDDLTVDFRIRIDYQDDNGYLMMLTYNLYEGTLTFDYRYKGLPFSEHKIHLIIPFLQKIIDYCNKKLLKNNISIIERDMLITTIKYIKNHISQID